MMRITSPCLLAWNNGGVEINSTTLFIRDHYKQSFGANLKICMPWLLSLHDAQGQLRAACGIMPAVSGPLFLEKYLDQPVEVLMQSYFPAGVSRNSLVEIGNFAASDGAAARVMYAAVCWLLAHYHYTYIVFTGTKKIRNIFTRLNLNPVLLAEADGKRLGADAELWGSYYQYHPQIMAGELSGGMAELRNNTLLFSLFNQLPAEPWTTVPGVQHA